MIMLKIGDIKHEFSEVDQFKGDHRKDQYLAINPTGSIPTITEGRFLILGGYLVFLTYLSNHHKSIRDKLYPQE
jgi:glutathione S-transferase